MHNYEMRDRVDFFGFRNYIGIANSQENTVSALLDKAMDSYQKGDYEEAIKYYDKAIEINSSNADAWYGRGQALEYQENYETAIECMIEPLRLSHYSLKLGIINAGIISFWANLKRVSSITKP